MLNEWLMTNYLLRGDKGYTIPEMSEFIEYANLDFLSMVNWRHWNVLDLFQDQRKRTSFLAIRLRICFRNGQATYL